MGLWETILQEKWLIGGLLSVLGAVLACVGLVIQKEAQYNIVLEQEGRIDRKVYHLKLPKWRQLLKSPRFWLGLLLYLAVQPINTLALFYAPETTVTPLGGVQVIVNFVMSYGVLHERFFRKDITATVVCIIGAVVMNVAMPGQTPGYIDNFPTSDAQDYYEHLTSNVGYASYLLVWAALLAISLFMLSVPTLRVTRPLAFPMLVGLLTSQFHFLSKIAMTLVLQSRTNEELLNHPMTCRVFAAVAVFYILSLLATCEGQRQLACRFFMPATYVSVTSLSFIQIILFFRSWRQMENFEIWGFIAACAASAYAIYLISSEHRVIPKPFGAGDASPRSPLATPLLGPETDAIKYHQSILEIMEEYRFPQSDAATTKALEVCDLPVMHGTLWRFFPIVVSVGALATPLLLWSQHYLFTAFSLLTAFGLHNGWKMGMHIALFAYVGCKKVAHYENADFKMLYDAQAKRPNAPAWGEVMHFVILPNYKEDREVLRLAIESIARSTIASEQIGLVLAMEVREQGSKEKAESLLSEFRQRFRYTLATYHPPGLPGETPGKSSNTKWAANRVLEDFMPSNGVSLKSTIFTVADADSEFHREYFSCLTYHFIINGGGEEERTPERHLTIWQPPILHMKNYLTQPPIVRLASYVTSQHELANLADPNATRVPYSTYSISAELASAVKGWDPDWISEDWHMALKCFLSTQGRVRVSPIFLPILNYAPEGDSLYETLSARWDQAKRHALGYSELVYWAFHFHRVYGSVEPGWGKVVFCWRSFFLWFKLLMIHLVMATLWIIGPINGFMIKWFCEHEQPSDLTINSWTFLINCVCQSISLLSFSSVFIVSVVLYEAVKDRVDGADDPNLSTRWKNKFLHVVTVMLQSFCFLPFFFFFAAAAEWVAAVKCAFTHKFDYVVAAKPQLDKRLEEQKASNGNA